MLRRSEESERRSTVSEATVPEAVRTWVSAAVGTPRNPRLLSGATTARVIGFEADDAGYVVKVFDWQTFLDEDPDRAAHEAALLALLEGSGVPAPRLVAVDTDGSECGVPAVLMSRQPGRANVERRHADQIVDIAASLHGLDRSVRWDFQRYNEGLETFVPEWAGDPELWKRALMTVESKPPPGKWRLIHRDYNSTNFLTDASIVTGVVDWLSACVGPPAIDAARIRLDLTIEGRFDVASAMEAAFQGRYDIVDPFWDLVDGIDLLPYYQGPTAVNDWGSGAQRQRLESWLRLALGRLT